METETVLKLLADNHERVEAYNWNDDPKNCPLCGELQNEGGEEGNLCPDCHTLCNVCEKCGYLADFIAVMLDDDPDGNYPYSALVEADEDTVRICRENVNEEDGDYPYPHIKMNNLPHQKRIPFCVLNPKEFVSDGCVYMWQCLHCNQYFTSHPD